MYIFILSFLLTAFISLCFFKKKFWENRYLILLIGSGVALVATLATNYGIRGNLDTVTESVWEKPLNDFYLNDSLISNQVSLIVGDDVGVYEHLIFVDDSTSGIDSSSQVSTILIYDTHKDYRFWKIGFYYKNKTKMRYHEDVYIAPSCADTVRYFAKKRIYYDQKPNRWVANFSLPHVKTFKCFYIPPTEYAVLPDSLIRKAPFQL